MDQILNLEEIKKAEKELVAIDWKFNMEFKAWDYVNNIMVDIQGIFFEKDKMFLKINGKKVSRRNYILLPYILKDKNYKKVFEGDILKVKETTYSDCSKSQILDIREYMATISIENYAVVLRYKDNLFNCISGKLLFYDLDIEIEKVGNIYENLCLLENA